MAESYELSFNDLYQQISHYSPRAALILDHMSHAFGVQTAYYAAFVITCLHAQREALGSQHSEDLTAIDLQSYTFFEHAQENQPALESFAHLLDCYRSEQNTAS